jgi:branched-chain amino acid transport system substrate-binding protein
MAEFIFGNESAGMVSRRRALKLGAGATGATLIPRFIGQVGRAYADDKPALGTWPAGSEGDSVTIGATVPRTGAYAVQGEDELKGMQLAVEHLNAGNDLIKEIAPKVTKGVLGKQVNLVVADSAAKPNNAVQEQQVFINENKIIVMTGATSSAVAVALNKFAQREKILYVTGISGSNDTTGKDCVRYGFRQCFYGETAANAIGPVLLKNFGKDKKAAFMTPDYTYGHTVTKSVNDYLSSQGGWTMVTNQVSPLGTQDFSQYLTNIASSGAEFIINVNWGQAVRPDPQDEHGDPLSGPVPRQGSGSRTHRRRIRRHGLLVDAGRQVPLGQNVRRRLPEEVQLPSGMGGREQLYAICDLGAHGLRGCLFLPAGCDQAV